MFCCGMRFDSEERRVFSMVNGDFDGREGWDFGSWT